MNNDKKPLTLLFNPFIYIAGARALCLGLTAILLAGLIGSLSNTHFDGVLDTHTGAPAPLWAFLVEGIINWACLSLVLLILGRIISPTSFRTIDLLGTQALARWPTLFIGLVTLPPAFQRFANELLEQLKHGARLEIKIADATIFVAALMAIILFVCWMVALMYKSFSISCNVKGGKAIGTFIAGLLVAEILSKLCLWPLLEHTTAPDAAQFPPVQSASGQSSTNTNTVLAIRFVDLLINEDFGAAVAQFDSTMKAALPPTTLQQHWLAMLKDAGPFKEQLRTRTESQGGYQIVFVTCKFERAILDMKVVFDAQQQIAGFFYVPGRAAPASKAK